MRRSTTRVREAHSPHTTEPQLPALPESQFKLDIREASLAARDTLEAASASATTTATYEETTFEDATDMKKQACRSTTLRKSDDKNAATKRLTTGRRELQDKEKSKTDAIHKATTTGL